MEAQRPRKSIKQQVKERSSNKSSTNMEEQLLKRQQSTKMEKKPSKIS